MILAGSTPEYLLKIIDKDGTQKDPSLSSEVLEVKIFIYNAISGKSIAKFILNENPLPGGFTRATVYDLGGGDKRVRFALTENMTNQAEGNSNIIQVDVHFYDTDYPDNERIVKKNGRFSEIQKAQT